jgi:hypothetical protein
LLLRPFGKALALVIAISLLSAGIAPANPTCSAECCLQPKSDGTFAHAETSTSGLLSDCCSDIETAPCPHMLESVTEKKEYVISAVAPELNPATVKLAVAASDTFLLAQPHFHVGTSKGPPIRGPSAPIYLRNLSLLI